MLGAFALGIFFVAWGAFGFFVFQAFFFVGWVGFKAIWADINNFDAVITVFLVTCVTSDLFNDYFLTVARFWVENPSLIAFWCIFFDALVTDLFLIFAAFGYGNNDYYYSTFTIGFFLPPGRAFGWGKFRTFFVDSLCVAFFFAFVVKKQSIF